MVFALVGALLLAMGVGVLIGRSDRTPVSGAGPQRVTVVLSGSGSAVTAAAPSVAEGATAEGTTGASGAATAKHAATKLQAAPSGSGSTPPPKAVKLGSSGSGPGYQKGKFTGNFFGGG
jgi:hypothetical protein